MIAKHIDPETAELRYINGYWRLQTPSRLSEYDARGLPHQLEKAYNDLERAKQKIIDLEYIAEQNRL